MHGLIHLFGTTKSTVNETLTVSNPFRQRQLRRWKNKQKPSAKSDDVEQEHHLACSEPCEFPNCMNSCRHSAGHSDNRHVCIQHDLTVQNMSQQPKVPQTPFRTSLQSVVTKIQETKSKPTDPVKSPKKQEDSDSEPEHSLIDSSSSGEERSGKPDRWFEDSSESESSDDDDRDLSQAKKEELTGKLDFDYADNEMMREFETYSVNCSAQLNNYLISRVSATYDALASEFPKTEYRKIAPQKGR